MAARHCLMKDELDEYQLKPVSETSGKIGTDKTRQISFT
jgi:hypothetical protein